MPTPAKSRGGYKKGGKVGKKALGGDIAALLGKHTGLFDPSVGQVAGDVADQLLRKLISGKKRGGQPQMNQMHQKRSLGGSIGGLLGSLVGGPGGGAIGSQLGNLAGSIFGFKRGGVMSRGGPAKTIF